MELRDFFDLKLLEQIMTDWSKATGMAAIAMDAHGEYITGEIGFTDFCMKYTKGSAEGMRRCLKCDNECTGTYVCHAGLMDFSIDIKIGDECLGRIIGGQVLPQEPDEERFRNMAQELGINPEEYVQAIRRVPVKSEDEIRAAAKLLGDVVNMLVNFEYMKKKNTRIIDVLDTEIGDAVKYATEINAKTRDLDKIENSQKILALNASIEAARAGEAGRGFAIVAAKVGELATNSAAINTNIKESITHLTRLIKKMEAAKE